MKYIIGFFIHLITFFVTVYLLYWTGSNQPWDRAGDVFILLSTEAALLSSFGYLIGMYVSKNVIARITFFGFFVTTVSLATLCGSLDLVLFFSSPNLGLIIFYILIPIIGIIPVLMLIGRFFRLKEVTS